MSTPEERVARGAAWLDANHPGWEARINLDTLACLSPLHCVMTQVTGDQHAWHQFGPVSSGASAEMGFAYPQDTAVWRGILQSRRGAALLKTALTPQHEESR